MLTLDEEKWLRQQKKSSENFWLAFNIGLVGILILGTIGIVIASIPLIVANHKAVPLWKGWL